MEIKKGLSKKFLAVITNTGTPAVSIHQLGGGGDLDALSDVKFGGTNFGGTDNPSLLIGHTTTGTLDSTNSAENNLGIKVANINGINDDKVLSKDMVQKIYNHSENDIFLITDSILEKNYLVNIEKDIQPNNINNDSIEKYTNKAKSDYVSDIYKSYDKFVNTKYKININEKVLERLKNSF